METPNYFAIIPANVRYNRNLKEWEKLLYWEVTALTNKEWYCFATNKYFAELYYKDEKTISRWINNLKENKLISVEIETFRYDDWTVKKIRKIYIAKKCEDGGDEKENNHMDIFVPDHMDTDVQYNNTSNIIIQDNNILSNDNILETEVSFIKNKKEEIENLETKEEHLEIQKEEKEKNLTKKEKEEYGNHEINEIIETLKEVNNWLIDGTNSELRNFSKLLRDKILKINWFNWDFSWFIRKLYELSDEYRIPYFASPKKLYYNLWTVVSAITSKLKETPKPVKPRKNYKAISVDDFLNNNY